MFGVKIIYNLATVRFVGKIVFGSHIENKSLESLCDPKSI